MNKDRTDSLKKEIIETIERVDGNSPEGSFILNFICGAARSYRKEKGGADK